MRRGNGFADWGFADWGFGVVFPGAQGGQPPWVSPVEPDDGAGREDARKIIAFFYNCRHFVCHIFQAVGISACNVHLVTGVFAALRFTPEQSQHELQNSH